VASGADEVKTPADDASVTSGGGDETPSGQVLNADTTEAALPLLEGDIEEGDISLAYFEDEDVDQAGISELVSSLNVLTLTAVPAEAPVRPGDYPQDVQGFNMDTYRDLEICHTLGFEDDPQTIPRSDVFTWTCASGLTRHVISPHNSDFVVEWGDLARPVDVIVDNGSKRVTCLRFCKCVWIAPDLEDGRDPQLVHKLIQPGQKEVIGIYCPHAAATVFSEALLFDPEHPGVLTSGDAGQELQLPNTVVRARVRNRIVAQAVLDPVAQNAILELARQEAGEYDGEPRIGLHDTVTVQNWNQLLKLPADVRPHAVEPFVAVKHTGPDSTVRDYVPSSPLKADMERVFGDSAKQVNWIPVLQHLMFYMQSPQRAWEAEDALEASDEPVGLGRRDAHVFTWDPRDAPDLFKQLRDYMVKWIEDDTAFLANLLGGMWKPVRFRMFTAEVLFLHNLLQYTLWHNPRGIVAEEDYGKPMKGVTIWCYWLVACVLSKRSDQISSFDYVSHAIGEAQAEFLVASLCFRALECRRYDFLQVVAHVFFGWRYCSETKYGPAFTEPLIEEPDYAEWPATPQEPVLTWLEMHVRQEDLPTRTSSRRVWRPQLSAHRVELMQQNATVNAFLTAGTDPVESLERMSDADLLSTLMEQSSELAAFLQGHPPSIRDKVVERLSGLNIIQDIRLFEAQVQNVVRKSYHRREKRVQVLDSAQTTESEIFFSLQKFRNRQKTAGDQPTNIQFAFWSCPWLFTTTTEEGAYEQAIEYITSSKFNFWILFDVGTVSGAKMAKLQRDLEGSERMAFPCDGGILIVKLPQEHGIQGASIDSLKHTVKHRQEVADQDTLTWEVCVFTLPSSAPVSGDDSTPIPQHWIGKNVFTFCLVSFGEQAFAAENRPHTYEGWEEIIEYCVKHDIDFVFANLQEGLSFHNDDETLPSLYQQDGGDFCPKFPNYGSRLEYVTDRVVREAESLGAWEQDAVGWQLITANLNIKQVDEGVLQASSSRNCAVLVFHNGSCSYAANSRSNTMEQLENFEHNAEAFKAAGVNLLCPFSPNVDLHMSYKPVLETVEPKKVKDVVKAIVQDFSERGDNYRPSDYKIKVVTSGVNRCSPWLFLKSHDTRASYQYPVVIELAPSSLKSERTRSRAGYAKQDEGGGYIERMRTAKKERQSASSRSTAPVAVTPVNAEASQPAARDNTSSRRSLGQHVSFMDVPVNVSTLDEEITFENIDVNRVERRYCSLFPRIDNQPMTWREYSDEKRADDENIPPQKVYLYWQTFPIVGATTDPGASSRSGRVWGSRERTPSGSAVTGLWPGSSSVHKRPASASTERPNAGKAQRPGSSVERTGKGQSSATDPKLSSKDKWSGKGKHTTQDQDQDAARSRSPKAKPAVQPQLGPGTVFRPKTPQVKTARPSEVKCCWCQDPMTETVVKDRITCKKCFRPCHAGHSLNRSGGRCSNWGVCQACLVNPPPETSDSKGKGKPPARPYGGGTSSAAGPKGGGKAPKAPAKAVGKGPTTTWPSGQPMRPPGMPPMMPDCPPAGQRLTFAQWDPSAWKPSLRPRVVDPSEAPRGVLRGSYPERSGMTQCATCKQWDWNAKKVCRQCGLNTHPYCMLEKSSFYCNGCYRLKHPVSRGGVWGNTGSGGGSSSG